MSRIHEALKKAAQERSAQLAKGGDTTFVELATAATAPMSAATTAAMPVPEIVEAMVRTAVAPETLTYLRYEDLVKKCAAPQWRIEGRLSVFEGNDDTQIGAERFRTLRSRLYQIAGTRPL